MTNSRVLYAGIGLLCLAVALSMILLMLNRKSTQARRRVSGSKGQRVSGVYMRLYKWFSRFPLTRKAIINIRSRIEMGGGDSERVIRKKTVQIYSVIWILQMMLFLTIWLVTKELVLLALFSLLLVLMSETLIAFFVVRQRNRLMKQQVRLNELIRFKYYETGMVDEAIYQAVISLDKHHHEVSIQGNRIYDVLTSRDIEQEMIAFNETAPNKFLKMLLGLAYMTMEYGDTTWEGSSIFMSNLADLTGEIRMEVAKREKLNYALKSLNIIVLLPIFGIGPIRSWAGGYFMPLEAFYSSQAGFVLKITSIALILVAFILLRRVQRFDDALSNGGHAPLEQRLYEGFGHSLVDHLKPTGIDWHRRHSLLRTCGSQMSVEAMTTRQVMSFGAALFISLALVLMLQHNQRYHIWHDPTIPDSFLGGQLSDEAMAKAVATTEFDNQYLTMMVEETTEEALIEMLAVSELDEVSASIAAKRLMNKWASLESQYFKWWELILCLGMATIGYQLPLAYLYFQRRVLLVEIQDEVSGFTNIILMLMHHQRLSVQDVLEWLALYASVYKEPIDRCLNDASAGMTDALDMLKAQTGDERFGYIIDSLTLASQDISLTEAFEALSSERQFYMEQRKEINQRIVERKINLGNMLGFLPVYGLIVLYMIIPMIVSSLTQMQQYFNQLK